MKFWRYIDLHLVVVALLTVPITIPAVILLRGKFDLAPIVAAYFFLVSQGMILTRFYDGRRLNEDGSYRDKYAVHYLVVNQLFALTVIAVIFWVRYLTR